ncbi:hypothetical protein BUALT_Bualt07G0004400 [Buddleja alternifolia]|uniref:BTB/POZ domain-containing protein n=1 Tax=Buddleja alternifolia TaxID=168488 RepID=A0AAV6XAX8_9LAMI|nr:hypothetical protein BUALT_Bualt07G0004400 [Buddleja alternifolia]
MVKERSASRCSMRIDKGSHRFTLEKYSLCKGIGRGNPIYGSSFTVGGYQWTVCVYPDGTPPNTTVGDVHEDTEHLYLGVCFNLRSKSEGVRCMFKVTLLDQSGMGNHLTDSMFDTIPSTEPLLVNSTFSVGYGSFIRRDVLEKSSYLKDDCLKFEFTLGVVLPSETEIKTHLIAVSKFDDVGVNFLCLLETGEGSDIIFHVGSQKFHAHKLILSARSTVFESMFATLSVRDQQEMVITDVEPRVFKATLHFIYTDALPDDEISLMEGYAFGPSVPNTFGAKLLKAADQYDLRRLKVICESHLWRSITLNSFAEILSVADRYNASELKHLCFDYATDNYADLTELGSLSYLGKNCPSLLAEMTDYVSKRRLLYLRQMKKEPLLTRMAFTLNIWVGSRTEAVVHTCFFVCVCLPSLVAIRDSFPIAFLGIVVRYVTILYTCFMGISTDDGLANNHLVKGNA